MRRIPYTVPMSVASLITAILFILLRMIPDLDAMKGSFIINTIIVIMLALATGLGVGLLFEKYYVDGGT